MLPSAAELVARFLKSNGYTKTLATFTDEAGLPVDIGGGNSDITIEKILQEKKTFDLSLNFEKLGVDVKDREWQSDGEFQNVALTISLIAIAPSKPLVLDSMPRSNILSVSVLDLALPTSSKSQSYFAATTADRRLHLIDPGSNPPYAVQSYSSFQDSPILDLATFRSRYLLAASMSGKLLLYDTRTDQVLDQRKDHSKYVVKLAVWSMESSVLVATAGWDAKVFLYCISTDRDDLQLGDPIATMSFPTIPETLLFIRSPEKSHPILLLTRRDSTCLYYYTISSVGSDRSNISLLGKQNLAPHSNAWVAFTPSDVQTCPVDPSIVAVATSSTPHMKLLIVKLLIPPEETSSSHMNQDLDPGPVTQASQARANLLLQDREEAAIMVNVSTMAPQTPYSTPRLVWRPDGSGIYVSSDDGIVRGFEANTGKLAAALEAHQSGSKLRCLWAGRVKVDSGNTAVITPEEEILLSGGFDQKLILWKTV
ncbi:hypothetical protein N0V90_013282 [Kalmusia sp. IMI 367209]|nr:hypothetical protein N0V90_013282 [Kalmusia sp. IMI 367209]